MKLDFEGFKKNEINGPILTIIFRLIGLRLARLFSKTSITPNQITIFGFFLFLASSLLFAQNDFFLNIFAGILLLLAITSDYLDGSLARVKNLESRLGVWLDGFVDSSAKVLVFAGIALGLSQMHDFVWLFAFLASSSAILVTYCSEQFKFYFPELNEDFNKEKHKRGFLKHFYYADYNIYFFLAVCAFFNQLYFALVFSAVFGWLFYLATYLFLVRKLWNLEK